MGLFGVKKRNKPKTFDLLDDNSLICENMNFAASESYKLLRTNLMFSFPDEVGCKVIGITSSVKDEGKSITSVNTAYSFAESGKKVLLIEADMRMPTISQKLNIAPNPGLSTLFSGEKKVIQKYGTEVIFDVIVSGDIPPNPSELLSSSKMEMIVKQLSEEYDYIIADLPPVLAVSDTLAISKLLNGIVVVVRQNFCDRYSLANAIRQLEFSKVKILGFVFNCIGKQSGNYYRSQYSYSYAKHDNS